MIDFKLVSVQSSLRIEGFIFFHSIHHTDTSILVFQYIVPPDTYLQSPYNGR